MILYTLTIGSLKCAIPGFQPAAHRPLRSAPGERCTNCAKPFCTIGAVGEPGTKYQPNEVHLTVAGLQETVSKLRSLNRAVNDARAVFSHTRLALRQVINGEANSVVTTARAAKKYLRSVYGLNSSEYSQVRKIKFNKTSS